MTLTAKTCCAGQGCPERDGCRRFEWRIPDKVTIHGPVCAWASLDIERQRNGECEARIVLSK